MKTIWGLAKEIGRLAQDNAGRTIFVPMSKAGADNPNPDPATHIEISCISKSLVAYRYLGSEWRIGSPQDAAAFCVDRASDIIAVNLTDNDIDAWHRGELTQTAADLVNLFGPFQVWGSRHGDEPLAIVADE